MRFVLMGIEHALKVKKGAVHDDATGEATDNTVKRDDDEGETFHWCINKLW